MRSGSTVRTTCPYCGVGCGVKATPQPNGTVSIEGDKTHPANFGRLCSKGSALGETVGLEDRLLYPEVNGTRASWDDALDVVSNKFRDVIDAHGPDAIGFYLSGQLLTEDYYVANKLIKGFIGTANVDTNSRLCMASTVAGHKRAFGADTVPGSYEDLEEADLVVLVGSNMAWCHPVLFQRLMAAKEKRPSLNIVVIDPRKTKTAEMATLHLPVKHDGDVALFNGLLQHLVRNGVVNSRYVETRTNGFADAVSSSQISQKDLLRRTGLREDELVAFYSLFAETDKVVTCFSQGVNQSTSGTDKVNSIINCHLATGRIGRKGMGPFSLTGQPNAMGGREVGGLANMLAAHMEIDNPAHRSLVEEFWGAPNLAPKPGLKAVELFRALKEGKIKALWIMGTNPMVSMPNGNAIQQALEKCDFVVVSDIVAETDSTAFADVKLPSVGWGEKTGTVTNSERRISRQRAFLPAPGEARPDWWQMAEVGKRLGFAKAFSYKSAADIFAEHAALSGHQNDGSRDFDISAFQNITADQYDALEPFQWPRPLNTDPLDTRFFANGSFYTPDRRANFVATRLPNAIPRTSSKRLRMNTGRIRDHWHTLTRTGKSPTLSGHIAEPFAEISSATAERLSVVTGDLVSLWIEDAETIVRASVSDKISDDSIFVPMHWNAQFSSDGRVNKLTRSDTDAVSGQPALKSALVKVEKCQFAQFGFAISRQEPKNVNADYWSKAITRGGWRLEFALKSKQADINKISKRLFGQNLGDADVQFSVPQKGAMRAAWFDQQQINCAIFIGQSPVEASRSWAVSQLGMRFETPANRYQLLAGRPGKDMPDPGPIVCSCFSVGANQILDAYEQGAHTVAEIGSCLSAGTNCGSCKAEISELINERTLLAAE